MRRPLWEPAKIDLGECVYYAILEEYQHCCVGGFGPAKIYNALERGICRFVEAL